MPASEVLQTRADMLAVAEQAAGFILDRRNAPVAQLDQAALARDLAGYDFASGADVATVAQDVFKLLGRHAVRSDHPRYFGLFNPPALTSAILGDLIAATVNPQLAVWGHAPAAAEMERKLVEFMAGLVWPGTAVAGTFTSGGTEANHTAVIAALSRKYPAWARAGLVGMHKRPALFASAESHLAWIKIARSVGLGSDAVRLVPTSDGLRLNAAQLREAIARDPGFDPFLIVGTAGTTAHGAVDDLAGLAEVAREIDAHFHVDAAWAGGGLLHPGVRLALDGIAHADSVTLDPHKWLAVPMACGMYLARSWRPLQEAFSVSTSYMPSASLEHHDAYIHSLQWSRRFIGLKLFMALATMGTDGYRAMIERQLGLADALREALASLGWIVQNDTRLPLVCFTPPPDSAPPDDTVRRIERLVSTSGKAWISTVKLRGRLVLRACITSFESTTADVHALVDLLQSALDQVRTSDHPTKGTLHEA